MVGGIAKCVRVPIVAPRRATKARRFAPRDSRECPGPITEAELSRPSTRRVLTAGALVLVAIAPIAESADRSAAAGTPPPVAAPAAERAQFGPDEIRRLTGLALAHADRIRPVIGATFPLDRAADAHAALERRAVVGKTLLIP